MASLSLAVMLGAVLPVAHAATTSSRVRASHFTIAFLPKNTGNPYFDTAFSGAKQAAAANGDTVKQVGPATADASGQVTYIKSLIQQHVNAIVVSADDPGVIAPSLKQAMARGIAVVSYDSDTLPSARQVFCNQANTEDIGRIEVRIIGRELNYKGDIAILSAASTATNQNAWIVFMKKELALPKYKNMHLVTTVYGNDDAQLSTTAAQGLLTKYPNLRGIISPTTVGIKAAAQVVDVAGKKGKVIVTGLGTPNDMRKYVLNGTVPDFALWNPGDLGYLAEYTAHDLAAGMLKAKVGASYKAGKLGTYKIGAGNQVLLGPPFEFTKANIGKFHF
ncbi:MAG: rhamnose ABC transporter substrate-binding protein [Chloroflexota bacterium]